MKYVKLKFTYGDSCHHIEGPGVGGGSKSAYGNTGGHHIDVPAELYAHGNGGGHHCEPGGHSRG